MPDLSVSSAIKRPIIFPFSTTHFLTYTCPKSSRPCLMQWFDCSLGWPWVSQLQRRLMFLSAVCSQSLTSEKLLSWQIRTLLGQQGKGRWRGSCFWNRPRPGHLWPWPAKSKGLLSQEDFLLTLVAPKTTCTPGLPHSGGAGGSGQ